MKRYRLDQGEEMDVSDGHEYNRERPIWQWFICVICLAMVSLTTGSVNLYPSQRESIRIALGLSSGLTDFMLTGGVMLLYVTLPCGLFMDSFGSNVTILIAALITIGSYVGLCFCYQTNGLFIALYLLMAFGSASLFIVSMQIVLGRSPAKIRGISVSCVSSALSLSFGLFLEIYKVGANGKTLECVGEGCVISGFRMVGVIVCSVTVIATPIAFLMYRRFEQAESPVEPSVSRHFGLFLDARLYILVFTLFLIVYDGMLVIQAGDVVWRRYGRGYPEGASRWGLAFSVTNCVFALVSAILIDFILAKLQAQRHRWFAYFWLPMGLIPLACAVLFKMTDNEILFAVFLSAMGIPFGFGLTHIHALVSECFGHSRYGFAFGIVQIGSITAAAATLPMINAIDITGTTTAFAVAAGLHFVMAPVIWFAVKPDKFEHIIDQALS